MTFSTREGYTRLFQTGDAGLTAANDLAVRGALEAAGVHFILIGVELAKRKATGVGHKLSAPAC